MREGHNFQSIGQTNEHDVVREAMNRHLPNIWVVYAGYAAAELGEGLDQLQRPTRFGDETFSDAWVAVAIPSRRLLVFDFCGLNDLKRLQRLNTSRSTRSSTVRQSVLASSPARAAATRRSISRAQAS